MTDTEAADGPVTHVSTPIRLVYRYTPGLAQSRFLHSMAEGKILGRRCPTCNKVYVPPRAGCSMCGEAFAEEVEVGPNGTVATYAIVNVNFASREIDLPYVSAEVLLDGADTTSMFLLSGVDLEDVRMGMRVRTHWKSESEWTTNLANIDYVEAINEPDADFDTYKEHV